MGRTRTALAFFAGGIAMATAGLAMGAPVALVVDAAGPEAGKIKAFDGANASAAANEESLTGYKAARIHLVRMHNTAAGDIDSVFSVRGRPPGVAWPAIIRPNMQANMASIFLDPNADPDDPASYNFGPTDRLVAAIRSAGAEPMFRLGRSASAEPDVPGDFDRYAHAAAHVVMHYNQGWANGFHYGIRHWEVWNEPDFSSYWAGTPTQFYEFYAKVATAVKAADPSALVGGPGQARPLDVRTYGEDFLEFAQSRKLPLDFYSWHWYSDNNDPRDLIDLGRIMRERLDRFGFSATRSIADEWDSARGHRGLAPNSPAHAAFLAAGLALMQDAPVDQALVSADHTPPGTAPSPERAVLEAWGRMQDSPLRIAAGGTAGDRLAIVAGKSISGRLVQVFVANYVAPAQRPATTYEGAPVVHIPNEGNFATLPARPHPAPATGYKLVVRGLHAGSHVVHRYRVSASGMLEQVFEKTFSGTQVEVRSDLAPSGVELVQVVDPA